jgi:signal transduction histidine kinase/CheY-like chemotaxis protein
MGSTFAQGFPELWAGISPLFEMAASSGIASDVIEAPMTVERNGYTEEAFFTGNFTPIRDANGEIVGFYNALVEVTKQKLAERRTATLNRIFTPESLSSSTICQHVIKSLELNELDVTLAIMYQIDTDTTPGKTLLRIGASTGVPEGHKLLVDAQDWDTLEGLAPFCRRSRSRGVNNPLMVPANDLFNNVAWRGPAGPSSTIAILPLMSGLRLFGYLVIGTNPRLSDEVNAQFMSDLARTTSGAMAAAVSAEESLLRQERLERSLAHSDKKIWHLVKHASVGMVHMLLDGKMIWANNEYFHIAGQGQFEAQKEYAFFDAILEDDLHKADLAWQQLLAGQEHVSVELRLKRSYSPPKGHPVPATILLLAFPYLEGSEVKSIMACTTDISGLKWGEAWQARLAQDAREAKRQQEAFIDVVSHEMRNPLSAIVHCADSIITSCEDAEKQVEIPQYVKDIVSDNVSAARIIETCANHQKYIIDSILTLGRLESAMLTFTPIATTPHKLCNSSLSLFGPELRFHDISAQVVEHPSIAALNVTGIYADESRITQIFINLVANAIKFVKSEHKREIELSYGACISDPQLFFPKDVLWPTKGAECDDVSKHPEWGLGDQVYMTFTITDSGIGIGPDDMHRIFERFKQANGKTHSKYGGSGLGLFISKQLSEKQGGEIGVRSQVGLGSSFVFYIRVRRIVDDASAMSTVAEAISRPSTGSPDILLTSKEEVHTLQPTSTAVLRILLVEDNIINQQVLQKHLIRAGFEVTVANHGQEALNELKNTTGWRGSTSLREPFSIILMDTQMPIMDGLTCTREIRRLERDGLLSTHVSIIAVTANARDEQVKEALAAGSDDVMQKPFKSLDLVSMMNNVVAKSAEKIQTASSTSDEAMI